MRQTESIRSEGRSRMVHMKNHAHRKLIVARPLRRGIRDRCAVAASRAWAQAHCARYALQAVKAARPKRFDALALGLAVVPSPFGPVRPVDSDVVLVVAGGLPWMPVAICHRRAVVSAPPPRRLTRRAIRDDHILDTKALILRVLVERAVELERCAAECGRE